MARSGSDGDNRGPAAAPNSSIADVDDTIEGLFRIDYIGVDLHLHEIYILNDTWRDQDLTSATGGPSVAAGSAIASIVDTVEGIFRIDYTGADFHLHDAYILGGVWHDQDLTGGLGGPPVAAGAPIMNIIDTTDDVFRINYVGSDMHLHEFSVSNWKWQSQDLTTVSGAPAVAPGASAANVVDTTEGIFRLDYIAADLHLHEIYLLSGGWHDQDLTLITGGPTVSATSSVAGIVDTIDDIFRIDYVGSDSHLHEVYILNSAWHDQDLTAGYGGPDIAAGSAIVNSVDTIANVFRINYVGADLHVHELFISGDSWNSQDLTEATGGPLASLFYQISGQSLAGGSGLSGVTVSLSGTTSATTTTDSNGRYSFLVPAYGTYTVILSRSGYTFGPESQTLDVLSGNQFAAAVSGSPGQAPPNPPVITGLSLPVGPPLMGFVIHGSNFGASQGSSSVTLQGTNLTVLPWDPTGNSITVNIPAGTPAGNGTVVVTVNGQESTATFTVTAPFGCSTN